MVDIHPQARDCQDSLERMRVATMQMCLSSSKPVSGTNQPSQPDQPSMPQAEALSSTEDQVQQQLQTEQDLLPDMTETLTQLFPGGDGSQAENVNANANANENTIPPLLQNQPRFFSNTGVSQCDKEDTQFSLDFLDIELFPGRLSHEHGSILGR